MFRLSSKCSVGSLSHTHTQISCRAFANAASRSAHTCAFSMHRGLGVCVWSVCLWAWVSALQPCMEIPLHESWIHLPPGSNEGQFKRLLTSQMLLTQRAKHSEYNRVLTSSYWSKLAHECMRVLRQPAETMLCACRCNTKVSCYSFANCAKPTT